MTTSTKCGEISSSWNVMKMLDSTVCNVFPYDETMLLWLTVVGDSGTTYFVTSDQFRREYFLFKGKKKTAKKSTNPLDLYKYVK